MLYDSSYFILKSQNSRNATELFLDNGVMQMERMVIGAAGDRASFNGKYELLTG